MKISFSASKKNDAAIENNVRLPYAASKRAFPRMRWILILLAVAAPFLIFLGKVMLDWMFVTSPGTVWMEKKTINSIEAGTIEKVLAHKGDAVRPDTVLFQIKRKISDQRAEQIALLEAEQDAGRKGINGESRKGPAGAEMLRQSIAYQEQMREDTRRLFAQGAATRAELDAAENKLREYQTALVLLAPVNPETNAVRNAQVEQSIDALKKITGGFYEIFAGQGGKVNSIAVSAGQSFAAGEPLAVVADTEQVHIVTYVDPNDFKKISIGTVATVKILGSGRKIKAVVEQPPVIADNVPSGISTRFYPGNMRGVQLFLKVLEALQPEETIEGLPVVVEW